MLQCFQRESWAAFQRTPAITFATNVEEPKKSGKKPKAAKVAPSPPEPEPFDNSTYKNLQHHSYHQYTFVDMEVEMEKHRLPQPSSGRPSPRH
uniref:Uncharacterized protein n=1 Tax=Paramormyrops kingsleyae TaxID=1676925 RepID=A0A3B3RHL8_9TELE